MKKFLKTILVSFLIFALISVTVAADAVPAFSDVDYSTPIGDAVNVLVELGITKGVSETKFGTDELVTRQQMAAFIYRLVNEGKSAEGGENLTHFTDLQNPTFYPMISWANEKGVIKGVSETEFNPAGSITLRDAYTMLCRALGHKDLEYPAGYIKAAEEKLGLNKNVDETIAYTDALARGSVALLVYNAHTKMTEDTLPPVIEEYLQEHIDASGGKVVAIGKKTPLSVVAVFSDDFSSVTIKKNGQKSDGVMIDWVQSKDVSPMVVNSKTLKTVIIESGVKTLGNNAFYDCDKITEIVLPEGFTTIGVSAFNECDALEVVKMPENMTTISDNAFKGCAKLKEVVVPNGVKTIGESAFRNCTGLKSIFLPETLTKIGASAFASCTGLEEITIPGKVKTISKGLFDFCLNLCEVTITSSATQISDYAFYECRNLTKLTLPETMKKISMSAFTDCDSLDEIRFSGTKKQWYSISFDADKAVEMGIEEVICKNGRIEL